MEKFRQATIPEIEKGLEKRLDFENNFLKTEDGNWVTDNVALAPVTAEYRRLVLDNFKKGKVEGVFNFGEKLPVYVGVSEKEDLLAMNFYVKKDRFDEGEYTPSFIIFSDEGGVVFGRQIAYLLNLGFNVTTRMADKENQKILKVKSTESTLTFTKIN